MTGIEAQQADLHRKLAELQTATLPTLTTAVEIARLTSRACSAFRDQEEGEQRKLLSIVLKGASWKDGKLQTTLFEPFELVRGSNNLSSIMSVSYRRKITIIKIGSPSRTHIEPRARGYAERF